MANQASGQASAFASKTGFRKSFDNSQTTLLTEAPNTFRIPISRMRLAAENAAKPK